MRTMHKVCTGPYPSSVVVPSTNNNEPTSYPPPPQKLPPLKFPPSMIYFPFMTKIILNVQLATLRSSKISQNMGFFNKKPFGGPRFFVTGRGGHDSSFRWGGGALARGGGGMSRQR